MASNLKSKQMTLSDFFRKPPPPVLVQVPSLSTSQNSITSKSTSSASSSPSPLCAATPPTSKKTHVPIPTSESSRTPPPPPPPLILSPPAFILHSNGPSAKRSKTTSSVDPQNCPAESESSQQQNVNLDLFAHVHTDHPVESPDQPFQHTTSSLSSSSAKIVLPTASSAASNPPNPLPPPPTPPVAHPRPLPHASPVSGCPPPPTPLSTPASTSSSSSSPAPFTPLFPSENVSPTVRTSPPDDRSDDESNEEDDEVDYVALRNEKMLKNRQILASMGLSTPIGGSSSSMPSVDPTSAVNSSDGSLLLISPPPTVIAKRPNRDLPPKRKARSQEISAPPPPPTRFSLRVRSSSSFATSSTPQTPTASVASSTPSPRPSYPVVRDLFDVNSESNTTVGPSILSSFFMSAIHSLTNTDPLSTSSSTSSLFAGVTSEWTRWSSVDRSLKKIYSMDFSQENILFAGGGGGLVAAYRIEPPKRTSSKRQGEKENEDNNDGGSTIQTGDNSSLMEWVAHKGWASSVQVISSSTVSLSSSAASTSDSSSKPSMIVMTSGNDGSLYFWNVLHLAKSKIPPIIAGHNMLHSGSGIFSAHESGGRIITAGKDANVVLSELRTSTTSIASIQSYDSLHSSVVKSVQFAPPHVHGNSIFASCGNDKLVAVVDTRIPITSSGCATFLANTHSTAINSVRWNPNSQYMLTSVSFDPCVLVHDIRNPQKPLFSLTGFTASRNRMTHIMHPAFFSDSLVISAEGDNLLTTFSLENGSRTQQFSTGSGQINTLAVHERENIVQLACATGTEIDVLIKKIK